MKLFKLPVFLLIATLVAIAASCPSGWHKTFFKKCITARHHEHLGWIEALQRCANIGATLLAIRSSGEQEELHKDGFLPTHVWIGGYRRQDNSFALSAGGDFASYSNWAPRQPDNHAGHENCVQIHRPIGLWGTITGGWNDRPCWEKFGYVCEQIV